jgi:hypothetical protein
MSSSHVACAVLGVLAALAAAQEPAAPAPAQSDPAVVRQEKKQLEQQARDAAVLGLGKEWKRFEIAPFLVLSEGQDAFARELAADSAVLWKWMGETFPYFAPESYAPAPILCVHATAFGAEADGYVEGGYVFAGLGPYRLAIFPALFAPSNVCRRVGEAWFQARDRDLYFALPGWMRAGLVEVISDARTKGGKVIFKSDTNTLNDFAAAMREGRLVATRKFLKEPLPRAASTGVGREGRFSPSPQAGQLLRYLLAGKGAKGAKTKRILPDYVAALSARLPALSAEVDGALERAGVARTAKNYPESRALEFEKLEPRLLPELFDQVFAGWTDKDFEALKEGYWFDKL